MSKYLPIESEPIEATFWDSSEPDCVAAALKIMTDAGLRFSFDTLHEDYDISIDVYRGKEKVGNVDDRTWLIIHPNGVLETMGASAFLKTYRAA